MQTTSSGTRNPTQTIVIAQGGADLRMRQASTLRRAGHVVWEAADGAEALRLVKLHVPQLLLMDIWMPVMNGLEMLEQLKGKAEAVGIRVVLLSIQGEADVNLEGFALGVEEFWTKDLSPDELCERVAGLLQPVETAPRPK